MSPRPSTDARISTLDVFDDVWSSLIARLDGLTTAEYLWEPVPGCWSVRPDADGIVRVDGFGEREIDPAPVTSIAWRLQHVAVDCLDSYSARAFGVTGASVTGDVWHEGPAAAIADVERSWACWRAALAERSVDQWWQVLGPAWGPFAEHSLVDLVLHALHEVTHHAAEVALLRDLYRTQPAT